MLSLFLMLIEEESDKAFFAAVYEEYEKQMWYVANKILQDSQLSEDASQEAFKRVAANIKTLRKMDWQTKRKYLLIAARNSALDIAKKENRQQLLKEKFCGVKPSRKNYNDFYRTENEELILYVIEKLPQKYRDVMYLRYVADLSEKEIAQSLGIKTNTVYQQISRGKNMFIRLYEEEIKK